MMLYFCIFSVLISACTKQSYVQDERSKILIVASPHPLVLITPVVTNFEHETGITVKIVQEGTGSLLSTITRYPDTAPYDILWGGSYTTVLPYISFFESYATSNTDNLQPAYKNVERPLSFFSEVPSVIMVNKKRLGGVSVHGYKDLLDPRLKDDIAFSDPELSSSSWEHLINMLYAMGGDNPENGWDYVSRLCTNLNGVLLRSSSEVYTGVAEGKYAVGLTFEEGAANYAQNDENIELVYMSEGVVYTPDGAYLLKNAPHTEYAKQFIDYVTGSCVQNYISAQMNRRSVRNDVTLKNGLQSKDSINVIEVDYSYAVAQHEYWIHTFHQLLNTGRSNGDE
ncbi:MAG: extracellular solute-binding protein [Treponema sp.]|nr:extracellular solute-binding protein [Treponema sp.]